MTINWSQLVTNILGFLLLLWGLRRFAWGPILGMLEERRETIASSFKKAEADRAEAESLRREFERQLREIDATGRKRIEEATAEGTRVANGIKEEARSEARKTVEKARADIEHERAKARVELRDEIVSMAILGAEKILKERLQGDGQERMVSKFIDELEGINA